METGIPVEIQGKYGEYYPAFISGIQSQEILLVRIFGTNPNSPPIEVSVPPSHLRLPADGCNHSNTHPAEVFLGQEVDVIVGGKRTEQAPNLHNPSVANHRAFSSWWTGTVSRVRGDFVVVNLNAADLSNPNLSGDIVTLSDGRLDFPLSRIVEKTEIVEKDQLRIHNNQPNLTAKSLYMHTISIPDCLIEYFKEPANYQQLAVSCGSPVLVCPAPDSIASKETLKLENETYEEMGRLIVVSTQQAFIKRATLIEKEFIRLSKMKMLLKKQIEEKSERLKSHFVEEFTVLKSLLSQAIGDKYCNINRAKDIPGVLHVEVDRDTCRFRITGLTLAAVKQARGLLDYAVEVMQVPKAYVAFLVGPNNRNIQALVDRVGLGRMGVASASEATVPDCVPFRFTGTRQAIGDARLFIQFNIASLRDIDRLRNIPVPPLRPAHSKHDRNDHTTDDDQSTRNKNFANDRPGGGGGGRNRGVGGGGGAGEHDRRRSRNQRGGSHQNQTANGLQSASPTRTGEAGYASHHRGSGAGPNSAIPIASENETGGAGDGANRKRERNRKGPNWNTSGGVNGGMPMNGVDTNNSNVNNCHDAGLPLPRKQTTGGSQRGFSESSTSAKESQGQRSGGGADNSGGYVNGYTNGVGGGTGKRNYGPSGGGGGMAKPRRPTATAANGSQ